jgi:hypothetical protein
LPAVATACLLASMAMLSPEACGTVVAQDLGVASTLAVCALRVVWFALVVEGAGREQCAVEHALTEGRDARLISQRWRRALARLPLVATLSMLLVCARASMVASALAPRAAAKDAADAAWLGGPACLRAWEWLTIVEGLTDWLLATPT